jgi:hypothetical protein
MAALTDDASAADFGIVQPVIGWKEARVYP